MLLLGVFVLPTPGVFMRAGDLVTRGGVREGLREGVREPLLKERDLDMAAADSLWPDVVEACGD
jgi:hypothetical protein